MNDIFSLEEAATFLKLKPKSLYNLVHFKKVKAYKPGGNKLYFKRSDLEKYAFSNPTINIHEEAERILNRPKKRKEKTNG